MASLPGLEVNVSTNLASLYTGLQQAADRVGRFGDTVSKQLDGIGRSVDRISGLFAALGVSIGGAAFVAGIKSAIDYADRLNDLSKSTGIAVETLGGLGYAAKQSGVDLDTVAKGVQNLARQMAAAAGGNDQLNDLFVQMGVSIKDATGALRPLDQVLGDVADKFASYKDGPEKAALATEIFKKGGEQLIPLLNEGGQALRDLVAEYERYGGVTQEVAARSDQFNDTLEKVKLIQGSLFREIASALLPTLQAIANVLVDAKDKGDGFKTAAEGIVVVVKALAIAGVGVVTAFQAVGKSLAAVAAAFAAAITGDFKGALAALKIGFGDVGDTIKDAIGRAATIWEASTATIAVSTTKNLNQTTAPIKNTTKAADELRLSMEKLLKPFTDFIAQLGKTGAELDAQLTSLRQYGLETKATAVATAEYELTQGKLADRLTALSFLYPQLADTIRFITLTQAQHNDETREAIDLEKKYIDAVKDHVDTLASGIESIQREIDAERDRALAIGRTRAEFLDLKIAQEESALASLRVVEGADLEVKAAEQRIAKLRELRDATANTDFIADQTRGWSQMFADIADRGAQFIEDFVDHGSSAFRSLWEDFKRWALAAIAKIAAQQVVVSLAGKFGLGDLAKNTFGGGQADFLSGLGGNILGSAPFVNGAGPIAEGSGVVGFLADKGFDGLASAASAIGKFVPLLGLAIPLLSGLFSKEPSQVQGQFGVQSGTSGFEDNAFTASRFGNLGFLDQNTQQFSGEAAQVFNKIVGGAIDAFDARYTAEQRDRLAEILQSTTFAPSEGTFTTEDFIKQYGGQVLQQVIEAAFDVLDPALAALAKRFSGDADAVGQYANTLLAVHDATKTLDSTLRNNLIAALGDASQETANKVLAFANVLVQFGSSFASLATIDPSNITAFVDALGGADAFFQSFAFLDANFRTQAERIARASDELNKSFEDLGVAVPQTHQAFLDLVDAAVKAGNVDLAASLTKLAPLFVQVKGTADQAAEALGDLSDAAGQAADSIQAAAEIILVSTGQLVDAGTSAANKLLGQFDSLASASPGDFGAKLAIQIGLIFDALQDSGAVSDARGDFKLLSGTPADKIYVDVLNDSYQKFTDELARFTILSAQYDAARAEQLVSLEEWYADLQKVFGAGTARENAEALAALDTIFQQKWDAIVNGGQEAAKSLDDFIASIQQIANATGGNAGQQAALELALSSAKLETLQQQYIQALPGSALATAISADISKLQQYNAGLAKQIANFAIYSAQYGKETANQLVELEAQFEVWKTSVAGNADALAIVTAIFNERFADIINGVSDGVDRLTDLRKDIADFLKGLFVGDLSPLTPIEKLRTAQTAYEEQLSKAQGGDLSALADITKFADTFLQLQREFSASSQAYTDVFNRVTTDLGALALTQPNGQPLPTADVNTALVSALPVGSTLASSDDLKAVRDLLQRLISDLANANTADSIAEREALETAAREITAAVAGSELP